MISDVNILDKLGIDINEARKCRFFYWELRDLSQNDLIGIIYWQHKQHQKQLGEAHVDFEWALSLGK